MKSITKFDWTYRTGRENGSITFEVIPDVVKPIPETIFKYHKFTENALNALLEGYIYAAHPNEFNDPFDCNAQLINIDLPKARKELLGEGYVPINKEDDDKQIQVNFRDIIFRKWGVYCTTNNYKSIALWAYYTDHEGFQIEFDYSKFPFKFHGPFPINYINDLKPVNISEVGFEHAIIIQTNIKKKIGFEKDEEWRLLIESEKDMLTPKDDKLKDLGGISRKFEYPLSAIKAIRLGAKFFDRYELKLDVVNNVIKIELFYEAERKSKLLEFLITNEIVTGLIPRAPFNELKFLYGKFVKVDRRTFNFYPIQDSK